MITRFLPTQIRPSADTQSEIAYICWSFSRRMAHPFLNEVTSYTHAFLNDPGEYTITALYGYVSPNGNLQNPIRIFSGDLKSTTLGSSHQKTW
jgi:hypothetical protein